MRITIIGAGFSGVALAAALKRSAPAGTTVCLVGVDGNYGGGVAYGDARPEHVLNVRARDLGLSPDDPDDFADWFKLGERGRAGFLPRQLYGDYLRDRLHALATGDGVRVHEVRREAVAIDRFDGALHVQLDDGAAIVSDCVVLAVGALPPPPLAGVGPRLAVHPRYIGWPWQERAIERIDADARILVVGTGLTMADVAATLRQRGHRGRIDALSRHGLLPQRHAGQPLPVADLPPGIRQALAEHDLPGLLRRIRALSTVVDWRALVDALRPHTQAFWQGLSEPRRRQFLRHLRSYWEVARHRIAPAIAEQIDAMRAQGQLRILAGRLVRAGIAENGVSVLLRERGATHVRHERYDVLLRATGLNTDVARTTHPLLAQLRESGIVAADRHDLGLDTTDALEVVDAQGRPVPGLYCLGPLLRGRFWEITAVPELRVAASWLARALVEPDRAAALRAGEAILDHRQAL
ncbi:pyridine nucleotide-disulfide oxidoreductase [Luteimonas marina]|uniref:Pyridine nucleotide-disulfide oxidoreductase n=1 Tax=Luteimonas marina TaxID=488485 RepID=A0A5C5U7V7_9GAMM|nr:FAD/NAD(P)-binding protein [Luteimonas marina]TWT22254.1 pyridine nucleotide-disulfide oxidoreductase [Luteimonas marina]